MKYVDLSYQYNEIREEVEAKVIELMRSFRYLQGDEVRKLEESLKKYLGVKNAIAVANGTDALTISLLALGVSVGDEVITTPFTFFATTESIIRVGAIPVFVDIDPETYTIDVNQIEKRITKHTKAIMPVHIFGNVCDMKAIEAIAKKHGLFVIEDACQAIGSELNGKKAGSFSDAACFSFFLTKNLGAMGEGGMICTNNDSLAVLAKALRNHGAGKDGKSAFDIEIKHKNEELDACFEEKYCHYVLGFNSRMDEIQAGILNIKMKHINEWNDIRNKNAERYKDVISGKYKTQKIQEDSRTNYHIFSIEIDNRNEIKKKLHNLGIETGIHYPIPIHLQPALEYLGHSMGDYPVSEALASCELSLPIYPGLKQRDIEEIATILNG